MNNKKRNILIISIIALIVTLIGSTYAFFLYSKTTKAFTLTSGDITAEFLKGDNTINLTYAYPISDNFAKDNLSKLGYIDFTVKGNSSAPKEFVTYEIYLEEDSRNTLDSSFIKVYLTDDTNEEIKAPRSYNTLSKTTYPNSSNGKIIYQASKKDTFEDKYRIYVWIDDSYTQNTTQETFSFKVNLYAYNDIESAVSVIKSKLVKYADSSKDDFQGGLVAVNTDGELYNEANPSEEIREYRYSGLNVDNYVMFNDEVWRIVGVFKDEYGEEHIKIVKQNLLDTANLPQSYIIKNTTYKINTENDKAVYWNYITGTDSDTNDWTTAGLQYYLNTEKDEKGTAGYLSKLSDISKNMIFDAKYYLGNAAFVHIAKTIYEDERSNSICSQEITERSDENNCYIWYGNKATWTGKVGLLYPSDWSYSANSKYWNTISIAGYSKEAKNSTWMYETLDSSKEAYTMFISPATSNKNYIVNVRATDGGAGAYYVYYKTTGTARPTLYLNSNVKITLGDGSVTSPYILKLGN